MKRILYFLPVLFIACSGPGSTGGGGGDTLYLDSGVKYVFITKGEGPKVDSLLEVTTHINLMINGDQDTAWTTYGPPAQPFSFIAKQTSLIQGFDEVIMYAKEGDRILAIIPPHLGYGARGSGPAIPPNSTLYFDIDFLKVRTPREIASDVLFQAWEDAGVEGLVSAYESIKGDEENYKLDDEEWYKLSVSLADNKAWNDIVAMWDYKLDESYLLGGYYYQARACDSLGQIGKAVTILEKAVALDSTQNPNIRAYLENLKARQ